MKTYELLETKHPDLFRVVDRNGNWQHYYHKPTDSYLRGVTTILDAGYAKGKQFDEWLLNHTSEQRDEILATAGEKGDKVHRAIDLLLTMGIEGKLNRAGKIFSKQSQQEEAFTNEEWDALLSFASFWKAHEPMLYISEASVFNLKEGYAGTLDALLKLTKACDVKTCKCNDFIGKIGLFDWKTSSGVRASYSAQNGAYAKSDNIGQYLPKKAKIDYLAVLRLGTKHKTTGGYEFKTFSINESYTRFEAAKTIADYEYEPFTHESITEIPDDIVLPVTVYVAPTKKAKKLTKSRAKLTKKLTN